MLSKISESPPELIFLDTLHHFSETLDLVDRVQERYPQATLHVYKPEKASTTSDFNAIYGERLWERDEELYDWVAKVEPAQRAYRNLQVQPVLTGRRLSQGGKRDEMDVIEVDEAGLIKINPFANWTFEQVRNYIDNNHVPSNELLEHGYKSVGDWHSTQPTQEGEDERAGRWKGREKTECGIHNKRSRYAQLLMATEKKHEQEPEEREVDKKADSAVDLNDFSLAQGVHGMSVSQ